MLIAELGGTWVMGKKKGKEKRKKKWEGGGYVGGGEKKEIGRGFVGEKRGREITERKKLN